MYVDIEIRLAELPTILQIVVAPNEMFEKYELHIQIAKIKIYVSVTMVTRSLQQECDCCRSEKHVKNTKT